MIKTLKRFLPFARFITPFKRNIYRILFLIFLTTLLGLAPAYLQRLIFDVAIPAGDLKVLVYILLGMLISNLFVFVFSLIYDYLLTIISEKGLFDIKMDFYQHIMKLPMFFFDNRTLGELNKVMDDCDHIQKALNIILIEICKNLIIIVIYLPIMFAFSWKLTLIKIVVFPITFYLSGYFVKKDREFEQDLWEKNAKILTHFNESVQGIKTIKAFVSEDRIVRNMKYFVLTARKRGVTRKFVQYIWSLISTQIGAVANSLLFFLAAYEIIHGRLSFGIFIAFNMISGSAMGAFNGIFTAYKDIIQSLNPLERYIEVLNIKEEDSFIDTAFNSTTHNKEIFSGNIEFKNVYFSYQKDIVLNGIDLVIPANKSVALVGKSGSGKSTIINLLLRYYDSLKGSIYFNNINIKNIDVGLLRSNIGIVLQENYFFNGTIKQNLTFGDQSIKDHVIFEALQNANALDFVLKLPKKIETHFGDKGVNLSGGQKQRLAIARAFIQNPQILVLDEATSALDLESEKLVQAALSNLMKNRTTLTIAHRLSTIINSDIICVVEKGQIVEQGNHNTLLEKNGVYCDLYKNMGMLHV